MEKYDKLAKEVIEKRKQINASAEALKKAKKKLKKEMTKTSGLALALERAEAKRQLTEDEKERYENKSKRGQQHELAFRRKGYRTKEVGKIIEAKIPLGTPNSLTPNPQSLPPNIPNSDQEKDRKRAREDSGDGTEKMSKS